MTISQEKELLKCTSLIHTEDEDGNSEQATCFFIKRTVGNQEHHYLVTCAHVLKDAFKIHIYLDYHHTETNTIEHAKKITLLPGDVVSSADLSQTCQARAHTVAPSLLRGHEHHIPHQLGTGAHDGHIAF